MITLRFVELLTCFVQKIGPDDDEESGKYEGKEKNGDYVEARHDSPPVRRGITATIGSSPTMHSPEFR